jgi:hypothetical protein
MIAENTRRVVPWSWKLRDDEFVVYASRAVRTGASRCARAAGWHRDPVEQHRRGGSMSRAQVAPKNVLV